MPARSVIDALSDTAAHPLLLLCPLFSYRRCRFGASLEWITRFLRTTQTELRSMSLLDNLITRSVILFKVAES